MPQTPVAATRASAPAESLLAGQGRRPFAIAAETATELLRGPVSSESGLGIGLYQVARHAEVSGFSLSLAHNADGKVSFVLSGALKPAAESSAAA